MNPRIFSVTSWGCTGTAWISKVLNSHPEIFCVHHINSSLTNVGLSNIKNPVEYLKLLETTANFYSAVGDVHGISIYDTRKAQDFYRDRFRFVSIQRDPFKRLLSAVSLAESWGIEFGNENCARDETYFINVETVLKKVPEKFHNKLTTKRQIYAAYLITNHLDSVDVEFELGKIYRFEDLTKDKRVFAEMASYLTNGEISIEPFIQNHSVIKPVNSHQKPNNNNEVDSDLFHDLIKATISKRSKSIYNDLGYNNL